MLTTGLKLSKKEWDAISKEITPLILKYCSGDFISLTKISNGYSIGQSNGISPTKSELVVPVEKVPFISKYLSHYNLDGIICHRLIQYDYQISSLFSTTSKDLGNNLLNIGTFSNQDFYLDNLLPRVDTPGIWSKPKQLSPHLSSAINDLLSRTKVQVFAILWLHMNGDVPVISKFTNDSSPDPGFTKAILSCSKIPIKEVYFIYEEKRKVSKVISKINEDGEYTLTIY